MIVPALLPGASDPSAASDLPLPEIVPTPARLADEGSEQYESNLSLARPLVNAQRREAWGESLKDALSGVVTPEALARGVAANYSAARDMTIDRGRSSAALPKALFGSGPITKVSSPPATTSACVMYDLPWGRPFSSTDWM